MRARRRPARTRAHEQGAPRRRAGRRRSACHRGGRLAVTAERAILMEMGFRSPTRASDEERERAAASLRAHYTEGRLSAAELEQRRPHRLSRDPPRRVGTAVRGPAARATRGILAGSAAPARAPPAPRAAPRPRGDVRARQHVPRSGVDARRSRALLARAATSCRALRCSPGTGPPLARSRVHSRAVRRSSSPARGCSSRSCRSRAARAPSRRRRP